MIKAYVVMSDVSDHFSTLAKIVDANAIDISKKTIYSRKKTLSQQEKYDFNRELKILLCTHGCFDNDSPYTVNEKTAYLIEPLESLINKYMPQNFKLVSYWIR